MRSTSNSARRWPRALTDLRGGNAKAVVLTGQGKIFLRRRRSQAHQRGAAPLTSADFCRRCTGSTTRCSFIPSRWWPRSTATPLPAARARGLRRPPHHGERRRAHRRHRIAGRRAVSRARLRDRAARHAAVFFQRDDPQRRDLSRRGRAASRLGRTRRSSRPADASARWPRRKSSPRCRRPPSRRPRCRSASRSPSATRQRRGDRQERSPTSGARDGDARAISALMSRARSRK